MADTKLIVGAIALLFLVGCSSPGTGSAATTVPVQTNAAQTQNSGRDTQQGTASAAETGAATNNNTPQIYNLIGTKKVTITSKDGSTTVEAEGATDGEVSISGAYFGNQRFGDEGMRASTSSGGGAAGGTGDAQRSSTDTGTRNQSAGGTGGANGGS